MTYPYSSENRLESPATYAYAAFGGGAFLADYLGDRERATEKLGTYCRRWPVERVLPELVRELVHLLPPTVASHEQAVDSFDQFRLSETVDTVALLTNLLTWAFADGQSVSGSLWLDRLIQRFEVSKKLYTRYQPGFRKGQGESGQVDLYRQLGLVLCLRYHATGQLRYLSTLLKLTDLLCSLPPTDNPAGPEAELVGLIVSAEVAAVRALAARQGVQFVS